MGRPKNQGVTALAAKTKSKAPSIVSARAQHEQAARLPANEVCDFELHSLLVRKQLIPGSAKKTAAQNSTQGGHPLSPRDNIVNSESQRHDTLRKNGCLFQPENTSSKPLLCKNGCFFAGPEHFVLESQYYSWGGYGGEAAAPLTGSTAVFFADPGPCWVWSLQT